MNNRTNNKIVLGRIAKIVGFTGVMSLSAHADLPTGVALDFVSGGSVQNCPVGGTPPNCVYGLTTTTVTGSWFSMDVNGDGSIAVSEKNPMTATGGGVPIGQAVAAVGSHSGPPDGTETPAFDVWPFFGNTGMHFTTSPISETSPGSKQLGMSGWAATWNGIPAIPLGGGMQDCGTSSDGICGGFLGDVAGIVDNGSGIATIDCIPVDCGLGASFALNYSATVPLDDPSGFGGVSYGLHLEGVIGDAMIEPGLNISFAGGSVQECSQTGGAEVIFQSVVVLPGGESIISGPNWSVDGQPVGNGETITTFVSMGDHVVSASVETTIGFTEQTAALLVQDTTPPVTHGAFIDKKTGEEISAATDRSKVRVRFSAEDICDPEPEASATLGVPVGNGDRIRLPHRKGGIRLRSSIDSGAVVLTVTGTDASSNTRMGTTSLVVDGNGGGNEDGDD